MSSRSSAPVAPLPPLGGGALTGAPIAEALRIRLLELRRELLNRMRRNGPELGYLDGIEAALHALVPVLDAPIEVTAADRAIVTDDGNAIMVSVYAGPDRVAASRWPAS